MEQKISMNFGSSKYPDSALAIYVRQVNRMMTGNPNFPNPSIPLAELGEANTDFELAMEKMKAGTPADTVIKNRLRKQVESLMKKEAQYVEDTSGGDMAIKLSSGFVLTQGRVPVSELEIPTNLEVIAGSEKGTLIVSFDAVAHARFYEIEVSPMPIDEESTKERYSNTKPYFVIRNRKSGTEWAARGSGAGSDTERRFTKWVSSYVL